MKTEQQKFWLSDFGKKYLDRNETYEKFNKLFKDQTGFDVIDPFVDFFSDLDKEMEILEFGCNVGLKLDILHSLGFKNLTGIDINKDALEIGKKKYPHINFKHMSIDDFKKENTSFDLVFTSLVLIHQSPENLHKVIPNLIDVTRKYIFCYEYFDENLTEIEYRGNKNVLWKQNFSKLFLDINPDLKIIKELKYPYLNNSNVDTGFLLSK
ncbi:methyltransferase domain-containing protein [Flavobacteriaceae bacterium]|nr:methyltransferase domain-containing protein [Flavobacteriaceae bacterium]